MYRVIELREIEETAWSQLVNESPVANWFQTPEAYRFYSELSFLKVFGLAIENNGRLKGVVVGNIQKDGGKLMQFFSRRAIITGGPLLSADITEDELKEMLNGLKRKLKREAIYVEMRNFNDYSRWGTTFEICGFRYDPHYDILVDTCNMNVVDENLGKSRKRDIRVSLRDGASIVEKPTIEQVEAFYSVLSDLYRYKVKTPLFPLEFFRKLYKMPFSTFLLVQYDGEIIGGTVCVGLPGKTVYEMYVCGRDGVYKNVFPSELATFAGMQYSATNGFLRFDMMGAGRPDDGGYGVREFKLRFGGELKEFGRNSFVCNQVLYFIGKLGVSIMKRI